MCIGRIAKDAKMDRLDEAAVRDAVSNAEMTVSGYAHTPQQSAKYALIPDSLHENVRTWISTHYPTGIYSHQAEAIEKSLDGGGVCLSTSTSSGKSLVFMSLAAHYISHNKN